MNAKALLAKAWKNEDADLFPGRRYVDEEFVVRVTGSVEKLDDEMVAPTVSIPLIAALALFWEKAGIVRDRALVMLREALEEAMTAKVKEDASIKSRIKDIDEAVKAKVEIDDEGQYGRSYYTDDPWAEERVYAWHDGKYDVKALVEEVGEWNTMIAATFGAINDMLTANGSPTELVSPITAYPNFEHLEFKGQRNHEYLAPFLQAMKKLADQQRGTSAA